MIESNLYQLINKEFGKEALMDKIEENKFRILEFGKFKPILNEGNLVHNAIAEIFKKYVPEQIKSVKEVVIWRKSTNETWTNYSEIEVKNHLGLENYENAKFYGFRIYQLYYHVICISSSLKDKLISEYIDVDELDFKNDWPRGTLKKKKLLLTGVWQVREFIKFMFISYSNFISNSK